MKRRIRKRKGLQAYAEYFFILADYRILGSFAQVNLNPDDKMFIHNPYMNEKMTQEIQERKITF
jgi:hypothetical protein